MTDLAFDHVAVPVTDVRASRRFYEEVLGLRLMNAMSGEDWEGYPWLLMFYELGDGRYVALSAFRGAAREGRSALPADARHYALSSLDLDQWREKLRAGNVAFREEAHDEQQSLYFEDPDRTIWEITSPSSKTAFTLNEQASQVIAETLSRWDV